MRVELIHYAGRCDLEAHCALVLRGEEYIYIYIYVYTYVLFVSVSALFFFLACYLFYILCGLFSCVNLFFILLVFSFLV